MMKVKAVSVPNLVLLIGTRVALGIGIGLLIAGRLDQTTRRAVGRTLMLVGALTTIPIGLSMAERGEGAELPR